VGLADCSAALDLVFCLSVSLLGVSLQLRLLRIRLVGRVADFAADRVDSDHVALSSTRELVWGFEQKLPEPRGKVSQPPVHESAAFFFATREKVLRRP
jgi:hypothetical protein